MVSLVNKIQNVKASIPITLTGQNTEIDDFINQYKISVTTRGNITMFPNISGGVISGNIAGVALTSLMNKINLSDFSPTSKSLLGSLSIIPNTQITPQEFKDVATEQYRFMQDGFRKIINTSNGAKPAECRYQVDVSNP